MSIVIALGLILGSALRLAFLDLQSLEMDELFTAESMRASSLNDLFTLWILPDPHLPLHTLALKFWVDLFGDSETSLRMPSALFSLFALWASYGIGKRVIRHQGALTLFVLLNAFSCTVIQYAQQARTYALFYLGAILSTLYCVYFFNQLWAKEKQALGGLTAAYTGSALLCAFSHYFGFGYVYSQLGLLLLAAFMNGKGRAQTLFSAGIVLTCTLAWLAFHAPLIRNMQENSTWISLITPGFLANYGTHILGRPALFMQFIREQGGWYLYVSYALIALGPTLFLLVPLVLRRFALVHEYLQLARRPASPLLPALYLFFVPLAVFCTIGLFKRIVWHQYLIFLLAPGYLCIAVWTASGFAGRERAAPWYGLASCLSIVLLWSLYFYVPYKDDVRSLAGAASQRLLEDPQALLVVDNGFLFNYYLRRHGLVGAENVLPAAALGPPGGAEKAARARSIYVLSGFRKETGAYWDALVQRASGACMRRDTTERSLRVFLLGYSVCR